jgi:hypothetical protein
MNENEPLMKCRENDNLPKPLVYDHRGTQVQRLPVYWLHGRRHLEGMISI